MVLSAPWREHFKVNEEAFSSFWAEFSASSPMRASELTEAEAKESLEFVLWCTQQGLFSEDAFIEWSSRHYEIPSIKPDYFETPPDQLFWERVKDLYRWGPACVPLIDWDDILLIGVIHPSIPIKLNNRKFRTVIGHPSLMAEFFGRLSSTGAVASTVSRVRKEELEAAVTAAAAAVAALGTPVIPAAAPVAPPVAPAPKAKPAAAAAPSPATSPTPKPAEGDFFAQLERSINSFGEEPNAEAAGADDHSHESNEAAPEGLIMPEGLRLNREELANLELPDNFNAAASGHGVESAAAEAQAPEVAPEGLSLPPVTMMTSPDTQVNDDDTPSEKGTVVHDFETGDKQRVERRTNQTLVTGDSADALTNRASKAPKVESPKALESEPSLDSLSLEDLPSESVIREAAAASMQPKAPPVAPPAAAPAAAPATPTAPRKPLFGATSVSHAVTHSAPAAAEVPKPAAAPAVPVMPPPEVLAVKPIDKTVVASMAEIDKQTQTGSGIPMPTAIRRRLEAPPVTSYFGLPGGDSPQTSPPKTGVTMTASGRFPLDVAKAKAIALNRLEPRHLDSCRTLDEAGAQVLLQASSVFETSMILLFKGENLEPWKWSDLFLSVRGEKPEAIDLGDGSFFKIVFRTAKPYHGYVVTSPINQKFFNEFYRGMLPKHATIVPIMIDSRMAGMILGFTNGKIDYRQSLRLMERLALDLARVFKNIRGGGSSKQAS